MVRCVGVLWEWVWERGGGQEGYGRGWGCGLWVSIVSGYLFKVGFGMGYAFLVRIK